MRGYPLPSAAEELAAKQPRRMRSAHAPVAPPPQELRIETRNGTPIVINVPNLDVTVSKALHWLLADGSTRLWLDGARVDMARSVRELLEESTAGGVLHLSDEQTGGGDEEELMQAAVAVPGDLEAELATVHHEVRRVYDSRRIRLDLHCTAECGVQELPLAHQ